MKKKAKESKVVYEINIHCIDNGKTIVPTGTNIGIKKGGVYQNMSEYPSPEVIAQIWIGKYLSYPSKKQK